MTDTPINDLTSALAAVNDKAKELSDSLKTLASDGMDGMARGVSSASAAEGRTPAQSVQALSAFLKQEAGAELAQLFGQARGTAQNILGADDDGITVIINNNTQAGVTASRTTDAFDRKTLEITIDQMVANSLLRGRETSGVLRTLFGIVPSLIGR